MLGKSSNKEPGGVSMALVIGQHSQILSFALPGMLLQPPSQNTGTTDYQEGTMSPPTSFISMQQERRAPTEHDLATTLLFKNFMLRAVDPVMIPKRLKDRLFPDPIWTVKAAQNVPMVLLQQKAKPRSQTENWNSVAISSR